MSAISTHVLDTMLGSPAAGIPVRLDEFEKNEWVLIGHSVTDNDGRCRNLAAPVEAGLYRLTFDTQTYFSRQLRSSLYTEISIAFTCDGAADYHLPLLLSDHSYTTYRGS